MSSKESLPYKETSLSWCYRRSHVHGCCDTFSFFLRFIASNVEFGVHLVLVSKLPVHSPMYMSECDLVGTLQT